MNESTLEEIRTLYMTLPRYDIDEGVEMLTEAFEAQLAKRPDREKIVHWFAKHEFSDDFITLPKEHQEICQEYADQVLDLRGNEEITK